MAKNLLTLQPKLSCEEMHWLWFLLDEPPRASYYDDKQMPVLFWFKETQATLEKVEEAAEWAKVLCVRAASEHDFKSLLLKLRKHANS